MNKRLKYGLMFLLLCLVGWRPSAVAAVDVPIKDGEINSSTIGCTDDRPQWQDVKMCDVMADAEGVQNLRILARNIAFLAKAIAAEKAKNGLPEVEETVYTNFIR